MRNLEKPCRLKRPIKCPKCGCAPDHLQEVWDGFGITFGMSKDGTVRDAEGIKGDGNPVGVTAVCNCGHVWKLRGITQITELDQPLEGDEL